MERSTTRSGIPYKRCTEEALAQKPKTDISGPALGVAESKLYSSGTTHQPGNLDTDSEDECNTEQLLQQVAFGQEQRAEVLAATEQGSSLSTGSLKPSTKTRALKTPENYGTRLPI